MQMWTNVLATMTEMAILVAAAVLLISTACTVI